MRSRLYLPRNVWVLAEAMTDRENAQNVTLLAIGIILLLTLFFLVPMDPLTVAASATLLVAVALAVGLWVWRFTLGTVDAAPEETLGEIVILPEVRPPRVHIVPWERHGPIDPQPHGGGGGGGGG